MEERPASLSARGGLSEGAPGTLFYAGPRMTTFPGLLAQGTVPPAARAGREDGL